MFSSLLKLGKLFTNVNLLNSFSKSCANGFVQNKISSLEPHLQKFSTLTNKTSTPYTNLCNALSPKSETSFEVIPRRTYESYSFVSELSHFLKRRIKYGLPQFRRERVGATDGKPFLKGIVLKTLIKKPKKPNSANRKCVRVRLSTGREATAYVPGIGHNLQEHHVVLVRGGKTQDLPGVKLKCVRGAYDLSHVKKAK